MFLSKLFSSTVASGQTSFNNSSLPTRRLPRLTRAQSVSKAFSESGTRSPSRNKRRSETSRLKLLNSNNSLFALDISIFQKRVREHSGSPKDSQNCSADYEAHQPPLESLWLK